MFDQKTETAFFDELVKLSGVKSWLGIADAATRAGKTAVKNRRNVLTDHFVKVVESGVTKKSVPELVNEAEEAISRGGASSDPHVKEILHRMRSEHEVKESWPYRKRKQLAIGSALGGAAYVALNSKPKSTYTDSVSIPYSGQ